MPLDFTTGIVRILLGPHKGTTGTGFVLNKEGLVVTCAHVVEDAHAGPGDTVSLIFYAAKDKGEQEATVLPEYWRASNAEDVAFLRLKEKIPEGVEPLPLVGRYLGKHNFSTFGFPEEAPRDGRRGAGLVLGSPYEMWGFARLQLRSEETTKGFSGAPVWDDELQTVIGMVIGIGKGRSVKWDRQEYYLPPDPLGRFQYEAFATPTDTLWKIYPDLRPADQCPYRNLEAFTRNDADLFFGRESVLDELVKSLRHESRFLAVLGPSGCGKSSLVQAGLHPLLEKEAVYESNLWEIIITRPTDSAFTNIATSLQEKQQHVGLIIDQFEELFTAYPEEKCQEMVALLMQLLERSPRTHLILTLRNDFYSHFVQFEALEKWLKRGMVNVSPVLRHDEVRDIIQKPADAVRLRFEEGLVEIIVKDVLEIHSPSGSREPGAPNTILPLLEFALTQLWERRDKDQGKLTLAAYRTIGGVIGGLKQWADEVYYALPERERELARRIFTQLVYVNDETLHIPDSRRRRSKDGLIRATKSELVMVEQVMQRLITARLLVTSPDMQPSIGRSTEAAVEIIHDSLLREWYELRMWLDEDRRFLIWRQEIERRTQAWRKSSPDDAMKRDEGILLRGAELAEATSWLAKRRADVGETEQLFIQASQERKAKEEQEWKELYEDAERQRKEAERQGQIALARALAAQALHQKEQSRQAERGALLARQAYLFNLRSRGRVLDQIDNTLRSVLSAPYFNVTLPGDTMALSSNGTTLATNSSSDGTIWLWSLHQLDAAPTTLRTSKAESQMFSYLRSLVLSPNGTMLALCNDGGGNLWLWDLSRTGTDPFKPIGSEAGYWSAAFSPDGTMLAASGDGVWLWDLSRPSTNPVILGRGSTFARSVAFSPDGTILASAGEMLQLWDMRQLEALPVVLPSDRGRILSVAFSPDGTMLAAGGSPKEKPGGNIEMWDLSRPTPALTLTLAHRVEVRSVAFNADGQILASGSDDGSVRLWNLRQTDTAREVLLNEQSSAREIRASVAFSPNGVTLASAIRLGTVQLWDLRPPSGAPRVFKAFPFARTSFTPLAVSLDGLMLASGEQWGDDVLLYDLRKPNADPVTLSGFERGLRSLAFSPDGTMLVSLSYSSVVQLWDLKRPDQPPIVLGGHEQTLTSVAFSSNGYTLASGGDDSTVCLWDLGQPEQPPIVLRGHEQPVISVAFSSDSHTLASGSNDTTVRLWDLQQPEQPPIVLRGHEQPVTSVAFSPDGYTLASGSDDTTVRLWNLQQPGATPLLLPLYGSAVRSVAFSPDGHTLASGSYDGIVRLWNTDEPSAAPIVLGGHQHAVSLVVFSPDRQRLISGSSDQTRIWVARTEQLANMVCEKVRRNLSQDEWNQFIGSNIPYECTCPNLLPGTDILANSSVVS